MFTPRRGLSPPSRRWSQESTEPTDELGAGTVVKKDGDFIVFNSVDILASWLQVAVCILHGNVLTLQEAGGEDVRPGESENGKAGGFLGGTHLDRSGDRVEEGRWRHLDSTFKRSIIGKPVVLERTSDILVRRTARWV